MAGEITLRDFSTSPKIIEKFSKELEKYPKVLFPGVFWRKNEPTNRRFVPIGIPSRTGKTAFFCWEIVVKI
jgi:hypothetical protein